MEGNRAAGAGDGALVGVRLRAPLSPPDEDDEEDDEEDGAGETLPLRCLLLCALFLAQLERGGSSGLAEVSILFGKAGGGRCVRTGSSGGTWLTSSAAALAMGSLSSAFVSLMAGMRGRGGGGGGGLAASGSTSSSDT